MPRITEIKPQKRRENRRNVYLDGQFAFGCNLNVVARFRLREGMELTDEQVRDIQLGEVKQECLDKALGYLASRLHGTAELRKKLARQEWGADVIEAVIADVQRLGYLDDAKFAAAKAASAAHHKHHGRRRARMELTRAGVDGATADAALGEVYSKDESTAIARDLALKQAPRLKRLDPQVARRRLVGMLQRRGFDYDAIRPVIDEVLGRGGDAEE